MLYLKNGYMIDPASGTEGYYDILIDTESGKIAQIVPQGTCAADDVPGQEALAGSENMENSGTETDRESAGVIRSNSGSGVGGCACAFPRPGVYL